MKKTLVCGIGNPMLKDDRAGIEVAEKIEALGLPVDIEIIYGVGFEVLDKVLGYERVFVIDAAKLGKEPGTIHEVSVDDIFSEHYLATSHAVTLGSTLKAGYELFPDQMPEDLTIYLIEAEDYFEFTKQCTPRVVVAIAEVVEKITSEVQAMGE